MKILGVGLSRTGTLSLHHALEILGFNSIHWAPERLQDIVEGKNQNPSFRRYDDVDAVTDIPAAFFYRELCGAYPDCLCILTVRSADSWYRSVANHYRRVKDAPLQNLVYGSAVATEFLYKKKFNDHNEAVRSFVPCDRLLEMNLDSEFDWDKLCRFLGKGKPSTPFPHANKSLVNIRLG